MKHSAWLLRGLLFLLFGPGRNRRDENADHENRRAPSRAHSAAPRLKVPSRCRTARPAPSMAFSIEAIPMYDVVRGFQGQSFASEGSWQWVTS